MTLLAVLTPAIGFAAKWGALMIAGKFGPSLRIVSVDSLVIDTATGAMVLATVLLGWAAVVGSLAFKKWTDARKTGDSGSRLWPVVSFAFSCIYFLLTFVLLPAGYVAVPVTIVSVLLGLGVMRKTGPPPKDRRSRHLWPLVPGLGCIAVALTVFGGFVPGIGVAQFSFANHVGIADGRYIQLARSTDSVVIFPCVATDSGATLVPAAKVLSAQYERGALPLAATSLWQILVNHEPARLGLASSCDSP